MRVVKTIRPTVSTRPGLQRPVRLHLEGFVFEMKKSEAIELANALADAVEEASA